jgi:hypothetical protein
MCLPYIHAEIRAEPRNSCSLADLPPNAGGFRGRHGNATGFCPRWRERPYNLREKSCCRFSADAVRAISTLNIKL